MRQIAGLSLATVLAAGCATYATTARHMESTLLARGPEAALATLEREPAGRDAALWLLNRAMLLRLDGQYAASNSAFEGAKRAIEAAAPLSVSEQGGALLLNEATRSFTGEPHEQVLLHLYAALNHLALGELDSARVEALQADLRMQQLAEREPELPFTSAPLARYLSGAVFEALGEPDEALIAYRKALEAFHEHARHYRAPVPEALRRDLLRLTDRLGLEDEHARYRERFGDTPFETPPGAGEVILVLDYGLAPIKHERTTVVQYPAQGPNLPMLTIAVPHYVPRTTATPKVDVWIGGVRGAAERFEDVDAVARATLERRLPAIRLRAVTRAVAKYNLRREAGREHGAAGALIADLTGLLTERADTRSWSTLPAQIHLARVSVPAGRHQVLVEWDAAGRTHHAELGEIDVPAAGVHFLSHRWLGPQQSFKRE